MTQRSGSKGMGGKGAGLGPPGQILPLTSARFFAALAVVLYHGWAMVPSRMGRHDLVSRCVGLGYVSVSFFFMLSGFILAIVYLRTGKPIRLRAFFVSRFARIYPLYLAAVLLDLPRFLHLQWDVSHGSTGQTVGTIVATVGLVQAWFPTLHKLDAPSWSLSAEAFFYLLFPFVGLWLERLSLRAMALVAVAVYGGGMGWLASQHTLGQTYNPLPHVFVFLLGIALARLYGWLRASERRWRRLGLLAPYLLLAGLGGVFTIACFGLPVPESLMQHGLAAPLFALVILGLASDCGGLRRLLSVGWLVVLGEASFSLYLIHQPILSILRGPIQRFGMLGFAASLALTVGLSVVSLRYLETPARRWILAKERVRTAESVAVSSMA